MTMTMTTTTTTTTTTTIRTESPRMKLGVPLWDIRRNIQDQSSVACVNEIFLIFA